jgi:uncharacterized protein YjbI with pentapeptide repeats
MKWPWQLIRKEQVRVDKEGLSETQLDKTKKRSRVSYALLPETTRSERKAMKAGSTVFVVLFFLILMLFFCTIPHAFNRTSLDGLLAERQCQRCDLRYAPLSNANLSGADLQRADLSAANLSAADLSGANLYGAHLSGAILSNVNLSGANLSGAYLSGAIWVDGITQCTYDSIGECSSWPGKIGQ